MHGVAPFLFEEIEMKMNALRVGSPFGRSCLLLALGCLAVSATAQPRYRLTVFAEPPQGLTSTSIAGINDSGRLIFGGAWWRNGLSGTLNPMGPTSGFTFNPSGVAINNSGVVAGTARTTSTNVSTNRVVRYDPTTGVTTNMGTLTTFRSDARAINNLGVIVGNSRTGSALSTQKAALFSTPGAPVNLATTGFVTTEASSAEDINDSGQIVGSGRLTGNTATQPLRFDGLGGAFQYPILAGDLGGAAFGINNAGVVVGQSNGLTQDTRKAVVWDFAGTTITALPRPAGIDSSTVASDINDAGMIIGNGLVGGVQSRALLWIGGQGYDLNTLVVNPAAGFLVATPNDINNAGVIVGSAVLDGTLRGYVLEPVQTSTHFAISTLQGQFLSGGIAEINAQDDQRYLVLGSETEPTTEVEIQSTSPVATPSTFTVELEAGSVYPALLQTVSLWDHVAGEWVQAQVGTATLADSVVFADYPTNGARFVRASDGLIRTKVTWIPFNDLAQAVDGWSVGIDAVRHSVLP